MKIHLHSYEANRQCLFYSDFTNKFNSLSKLDFEGCAEKHLNKIILIMWNQVISYSFFIFLGQYKSLFCLKIMVFWSLYFLCLVSYCLNDNIRKKTQWINYKLCICIMYMIIIPLFFMMDGDLFTSWLSLVLFAWGYPMKTIRIIWIYA